MSPLFSCSYELLMQTEPGLKAHGVQALYQAMLANTLSVDSDFPVQTAIIAGAPANLVLVDPKHVPRRRLHSLEGQAAMIHALVHIEFNAINIALDAIYRFRQMPIEYYQDWLKVAAEESYHFQLLSQRLAQLNYQYGDFPAHNGLWEMVQKTGYDVLVRMALVPRLLEARGLDVVPSLAQRFLDAGDTRTADILGIIFTDEINHVLVGNRWYHYLCQQRQQDPMQTFLELLDLHAPTYLKGPYEFAARQKAGFSEAELSWLAATTNIC